MDLPLDLTVNSGLRQGIKAFSHFNACPSGIVWLYFLIVGIEYRVQFWHKNSNLRHDYSERGSIGWDDTGIDFYLWNE